MLSLLKFAFSAKTIAAICYEKPANFAMLYHIDNINL